MIVHNSDNACYCVLLSCFLKHEWEIKPTHVYVSTKANRNWYNLEITTNKLARTVNSER